MINKFKNRFDELEIQMGNLEKTKTLKSDHYGTYEYVNDELLDEWTLKVKNLFVHSCGNDSEHYQEFIKAEVNRGCETSYTIFKRVKSVFNAAKEDYFGGYIVTQKSIIQSEVFDNELEQSRELLSNGYYVAAAVIAGVVLETSIRELCIRNSISIGKLDRMNSELAKSGIYNTLIQKRITALADIRNKAAHGKKDEFSENDVKLMIDEIEHLLSQIL